MPDNQRILSGGKDRTVAVWLLAGTCKTTIPRCTPATVLSLVALPDNLARALRSLDTTIKLFNVNDGAGAGALRAPQQTR